MNRRTWVEPAIGCESGMRNQWSLGALRFADIASAVIRALHDEIHDPLRAGERIQQYRML
jgi:hypothetical protein